MRGCQKGSIRGRGRSAVSPSFAWSKGQAKEEEATAEYPVTILYPRRMVPNATMSLRNVHKLSAFHLRQELVRRDKFKQFFPNEDNVCYDTLLNVREPLFCFS